VSNSWKRSKEDGQGWKLDRELAVLGDPWRQLSDVTWFICVSAMGVSTRIQNAVAREIVRSGTMTKSALRDGNDIDRVAANVMPSIVLIM